MLLLRRYSCGQMVHDLRKLFRVRYERKTVQCAGLGARVTLEVRTAVARRDLLNALGLRLDACCVPRLLLRDAIVAGTDLRQRNRTISFLIKAVVDWVIRRLDPPILRHSHPAGEQFL